jgi:hypothetical protein
MHNRPIESEEVSLFKWRDDRTFACSDSISDPREISLGEETFSVMITAFAHLTCCPLGTLVH